MAYVRPHYRAVRPVRGYHRDGPVAATTGGAGSALLLLIALTLLSAHPKTDEKSGPKDTQAPLIRITQTEKPSR
ncbi:hypothetical protein ACFW1M_17555 [Streptomyces inhibens]|uniref:hypothetical protein n=1 Tax=Streptomyces inhibens TaxID=2293571 RepID=UPI0036CB7DB9